MENRIATCERNTNETKIKVTINLDGRGTADISTGIGFFDHMLEGFARHGLFDLEVKVDGDLHVDCHHSVEDTGIVLVTVVGSFHSFYVSRFPFGAVTNPFGIALKTVVAVVSACRITSCETVDFNVCFKHYIKAHSVTVQKEFGCGRIM